MKVGQRRWIFVLGFVLGTYANTHKLRLFAVSRKRGLRVLRREATDVNLTTCGSINEVGQQIVQRFSIFKPGFDSR
jgi:hypothetical protein